MYQDPKQQNETTNTNQVKRLKRNDPENVDFTSDNLSHIMLLNIMAVSRDFIFSPPHEQLKLKFDTHMQFSGRNASQIEYQSVRRGRNR